jgi:hypothetical protein
LTSSIHRSANVAHAPARRTCAYSDRASQPTVRHITPDACAAASKQRTNWPDFDQGPVRKGIKLFECATNTLRNILAVSVELMDWRCLSQDALL